MMFSDNFDYQTLKRDFVVGTLSEEELGKKIYLHVLQVGLVFCLTGASLGVGCLSPAHAPTGQEKSVRRSLARKTTTCYRRAGLSSC
jgi:hypothetical protein